MSSEKTAHGGGIGFNGQWAGPRFHPSDPRHPNYGITPAKRKRPKSPNSHEPPPTPEGFKTYRMQCTACPDFFATWTCPVDYPFGRVAHDWHDFHADIFESGHHHAAEGWHEPHCGGEMVITLDGQPFVWPANPLPPVVLSIVKAMLPKPDVPPPTREQLEAAAKLNPEAAAAAAMVPR